MTQLMSLVWLNWCHRYDSTDVTSMTQLTSLVWLDWRHWYDSTDVTGMTRLMSLVWLDCHWYNSTDVTGMTRLMSLVWLNWRHWYDSTDVTGMTQLMSLVWLRWGKWGSILMSLTHKVDYQQVTERVWGGREELTEYYFFLLELYVPPSVRANWCQKRVRIVQNKGKYTCQHRTHL